MLWGVPPPSGSMAIRTRRARAPASSIRKRTVGSLGKRTRLVTLKRATLGREVDAAPYDVPPPEPAGGYEVPPAEAAASAGERTAKSRQARAKERRMSTP